MGEISVSLELVLSYSKLFLWQYSTGFSNSAVINPYSGVILPYFRPYSYNYDVKSTVSRLNQDRLIFFSAIV